MFSYKTFKNAVHSLIRNKWLTFATVTVMTLTLFTVSVFIILSILINSTIDTVKSKIDLEVYFNDNIAETDILNVKRDISNMPEIKDIKYISKEQAFQDFKESNKNDPALYETITEKDNPIPASLRINVTKAEDTEKINALFRGGKYDAMVYNTSYEKNRNVVQKLISFGGYVNKGGIVLSLIFIITSLIVVLNTIRMTMYTRKEEIEIMKLVGATNWYIRWPFILEGAFYGLISMLFASAAVIIALRLGEPSIRSYFSEFGSNFYNSIYSYGVMIIAWQFGISIAVSVVSAFIAISRYLKG
ncbi:MAG TPA: permease-like cell division protein FtsX [Patescibacteria group bacterium]|nr:permease-like cell division protein FtsX [Patescibacteria group bacterium]